MLLCDNNNDGKLTCQPYSEKFCDIKLCDNSIDDNLKVFTFQLFHWFSF